jgi:hypothetical protein
MRKGDFGMGLGMAALMAICCGGKLLLLAIAAPALALATGQTLLIVGAVVVSLLALGLLAWRRGPRLGPRSERGGRQVV